MRKASTERKSAGSNESKVIRATFEVPAPLYSKFRDSAKQRDQTFSQEMRRLMREYVEQAAA